MPPCCSAVDLPDDIESLKRLIVATHDETSMRSARRYEQCYEKLRFQIAVLKRQKYGRSSEQADRELLQMQLQLEDLEASPRARAAHTLPPGGDAGRKARAPTAARSSAARADRARECLCLPGLRRRASPRGRRRRRDARVGARALQGHPPRAPEVRLQQVREARAGARAGRPIARGLAGPGLLAHVLVGKYADHLPLYRQSQIFARDGIDLDRSTLADWVGGASELLSPLIEALGRYVIGAEKLHADDTPVPVLCPGRGTTKPRAAVDLRAR